MPVRTCIGCRERAEQDELARFAVVDGVLEEGRRLTGRGAWLHPSRACFEAAVQRRAFNRALRTFVSIPLDLKDTWPRSA